MNPQHQQKGKSGKAAAINFIPQPLLIPFFNFSHKWPTFTFTGESGYTLGFRRKIAHKGLHGETGAFRTGPLSLPSDCFTRFGNPAWPGGRTANFAAFGSRSRVLPKNTESLRDSDALMCIAAPRRRGPAGLRDPVAIVSMIKNMINPWAVSFLIFLLGKCKFYQKGCFTALLIRRNRWLPIFQPRLVDFWRAFW